MGTYLEDYLESMYMLPSEIKRNFDLMRELDKVTVDYALSCGVPGLVTLRTLIPFLHVTRRHRTR